MKQDPQFSLTTSSLHCLDDKALPTVGAHSGE